MTADAHADLCAAILLAAPRCGCRLFRNPSGRATYIKGGRTWTVPYGVGPHGGGGGDLLGWRIRDGRFVSIEVKTGTATSKASQKKWARWVKAGGGIAGEARSVQDAERIMRGD